MYAKFVAPLSLSLKYLSVMFGLAFVFGLFLRLGLGYCFSLLEEFSQGGTSRAANNGQSAGNVRSEWY